MTARERTPLGPISAPFGLTPARCVRTEIFVRAPGSRDIPTISTVRSLTSGTSSAKSALTRAGWVRERTISGPFSPCLTSTTKALMRSPCLNDSVGTCSLGGIFPSTFPRST